VTEIPAAAITAAAELPDDLPAGALELATAAVHRLHSPGDPCGCTIDGEHEGTIAAEADAASEAVWAAYPLIAAQATQEAVKQHLAEQRAVHEDLALLLRVLGLGDHARPQSPHEVMLDAINEVGKLRQAADVIAAQAAAAERDAIIAVASELRAIRGDHPKGARASFADYLRVTRDVAGRKDTTDG
jgi:hypothetical protein